MSENQTWHDALKSAHPVVRKLLTDTISRRGWRQEWDAFDDEIKREIIEHWTMLVTGEASMASLIDPRDDIQKRKEAFYRDYIGTRTREQLAAELFNVYMTCRSNSALVDEDDDADPWPVNLDLSDVVDKYVCQPLHDEINTLSKAKKGKA